MTSLTLSDRRTKEHIAEFEEQGYTIIPDALDHALVADIREAVDALIVELGAKPRTDRFGGFKTIKIQNLIGHGAVFRRLAVAEVVRPIIEHAIGPGYQLTSNMSLDLQPGEDVQPFHTDDQIYGKTMERPRPPLVCNTIYAITDFTAENGATRVIPGSHKARLDPGKSIEEVVAKADEPPPAEVGEPIPAVMKAGSVVVLHGSLWHGGGANRSDKRRLGIAMDHCVGWLRPTSNNMFSVPMDEVLSSDPYMQQLLGFGVYDQIIGRIEGGSPIDYIKRHRS
jgi:ectoine hydroxylase-related dioxygenase (phytanoyl-CoA dioxygenase family)